MLLPSMVINVYASTTTPIVIATTGGEGGEEETIPETGEQEGSGEGVGDGELGDEETETPPQVIFEGVKVTRSNMPDQNLYTALLDIYGKHYADTHEGEEYLGDAIYTDMFKEIEIINIDKTGTASLVGMERLELDNLTTFSANINELTVFDGTWFRYTNADKFKTLSLAGNQLSKIDLSAYPRLTKIDLSSNKISSIDLSTIEGKTAGTTIEINLANNKVSSIADILLPSKRISHISLNIINNNITDINESYFSSFYTMQIGIQGFVGQETLTKIDTANPLKVYKTGIGGLYIEIWRTDGAVEDELITTISDADITEEFKTISLPVGEYEYRYMVGGEGAFSRSDHTRLYLTDAKFGVIPQKATYYFTYKGEDYETLGKVTGKVTVTLETQEEGAKIIYSVNGSDWVEGNVVECDKGGSYSIKVKTVVNGVESEEESIWVRTSLNLYVSDWLMLVLLILLALVLFFVVLPIISKKYFKKD